MNEPKKKNPAAVALGRLSRRQNDFAYMTLKDTKAAAKEAKKSFITGLKAANEMGISPARFCLYLNGKRRAPLGLFDRLKGRKFEKSLSAESLEKS